MSKLFSGSSKYLKLNYVCKVNYFVTAGYSVAVYPSDRAESTPLENTLHQKVFIGDIDAVRQMLKDGTDISQKDVHGKVGLSTQI
jgi:hypothetical protein